MEISAPIARSGGLIFFAKATRNLAETGLHTDIERAGAGDAILPDDKGAYVLVVELDAPLALAIPSLAPAVLAPGRYAYCGSAHGPGGLKARVGRHLRSHKAMRWHIDRLTQAGRVAAVGLEPGGSECALVARLMETAGAAFPLRGFGSSDCRRCRSHLVQVPAGFDPTSIATARTKLELR